MMKEGYIDRIQAAAKIIHQRQHNPEVQPEQPHYMEETQDVDFD